MTSETKPSKGVDLKFVTTFQLCPRSPGLTVRVDPTKSEADHKKLIDEAIESYLHDYRRCERYDVRNVLIEFYIQYSARKNLKKYLFDKFNSVKINADNCLFEYVIDDVMGEMFEEISSLKVFNVKHCLHILNFLSAYMQNCEASPQFEFYIEKVALFYLCIMEVFTSQFYHTCENANILQNDDCYTILDSTLKHLLVASVKTNGSKSLQYNFEFVRFCHEIIKHRYLLKFETIAKCALLLAHLLARLPDSEKEQFKWKQFPILDFLENHSDKDFCLTLKEKKLANVFLTETMKVILCSAVYNSIDAINLTEFNLEQTQILEILYKNFLKYGQEMTGFPEQIILITRLLGEIGDHLGQLQNFDTLFVEGLHFIWAHLDHFVESVVHATKLFLGKLLEWVKKLGDSKNFLLDTLFHALNSMTLYSKVKLTALEVMCGKVGVDVIVARFEQLRGYLLTVVLDGNMGILAGNIYIDLMAKHLVLNDDEGELIRTWIAPVMEYVRKPDLENVAVYQKIITYGFHIKPSIFGKLFPPKYIGNIVESTIILRCVHMARTKKISFVDPESNESEYWRGLILKKKLELYMIHQDEEVRLWALQVMVDTQKSTEEFTEWEILYLLSYFSYNVATQLPSIRKRIGSLYQRLFTRLQASYKVIVRKITSLQNLLKNKEDLEAKEELSRCERVKKYYRGFLLQFIGLLHANLAPDASYSRKCISLELLLVLHEIATPTEWRKSFAQDEIINVKSILLDSYESNKTMAVRLLKTLPATVIGFESEKTTREYVERCLVLACDIKPSKSISASYMLQVALQSPFPFKIDNKDHALYKDFRYFLLIVVSENLERMFEVSKRDVLKAARKTPFHGLLLSARSLLQNRALEQAKNEIYIYCFNKLAGLCLSIKDQVMPIVCNASPEGHIPEGDENLVEVDESSTAQMVLVYAWKTMKEIMLLLAELARQTVALQQRHNMLPVETLAAVGCLFIKIFVQTKHRGVFEQAHVAFATICEAYLKSKHKSINTLPIVWLKEAILLCTGKKVDESLCSTRRSAGLPFLVLSLVSTLADSNKYFFRRSMDELIDSAYNMHEAHEEHRTHCLNTLRFIFINSKLGDLVPAYVSNAVMASISGCATKAWGVRNSATLLFSALITRIFGVQRTQDSAQLSPKNRMTLAVFCLRYPQLFGFLLKLLSEECEHVDSLMLHPVLIILARLYPSHNDKINDQVEKQIPCINTCIANPTFRTRELAARASVSLFSVNFQARRLLETFSKIADRDVKDVECHGLLLQVWHLFKTINFNEELPISDYLRKSIHLLEGAGKKFSHLTVSLYMKVLSLLLIKFKNFSDLEILKEILMSLSKQNTYVPLSTARTSFTWNRFQLLLIIIINKFQHVDITYDILTRELIQYLYSEDTTMKRNCLYTLIYLNQTVSEDEYKEHPLITSGDVEIPSHIQELVNSFDVKSRKELLTCTHPYLRCFFFGELKKLRSRQDKECFTLTFLLLRFYPCIFSSLHVVKEQQVLNFLLHLAEGDDAELTAAVLTCIKTFLLTLAKSDWKKLKFKRLVKLLMKSASPAAADFLRLTVAQFLVCAQFLFKNPAPLSDFDKYNVFNIILVLLEDEELIVRNTMSSYPVKERVTSNLNKSLWVFIPDKTRSDLLQFTVNALPNEIAVCLLVSWATRHLPELTTDKSQVFERGELNVFAENIPVSYSACKVLNSLLWPLGENLTYEDKSIFLEEQTLLVTTVVLNALIKIPSPMVDTRTKTTIICALKCVIKFLEESSVGSDFHKNFKAFFSTKILKYLRATLKTDYSSVKYFLSYLYSNVLKANNIKPAVTKS